MLHKSAGPGLKYKKGGALKHGGSHEGDPPDNLTYAERKQAYDDSLTLYNYSRNLLDLHKELEEFPPQGNMEEGGQYDLPKVKQRKGVRENPDGTVSTHLMRAEYIPERGWVAFPSLFQNDDGTWLDMSQVENWEKILDEASKRGEVYEFGDDKFGALAFGMGSWKPENQKYNLKRALELGLIQKSKTWIYITVAGLIIIWFIIRKILKKRKNSKRG